VRIWGHTEELLDMVGSEGGVARAAEGASTRGRLPSFAVLLPMYNEEAAAAACVRNISAFLATLGARTGIVAVNDGSGDATAKVLCELQRSIPGLIVETHSVNQGYGAANRTGYRAAIRAGFRYVLVMDSDGTQNPKEIARFFPPMRAGVEFIKATRYAKGGRVVGVGWQRVLISKIGNWLAKFLLRLPITDYTNGFRAIFWHA
jgi:dolichol-phosphate mannosyltransferase